MKKRFLIIFAVLLAAFCFCVSAGAESPDEENEILKTNSQVEEFLESEDSDEAEAVPKASELPQSAELSKLSDYLDGDTKKLLQEFGIDPTDYKSFLNLKPQNAFRAFFESIKGTFSAPLAALGAAAAVLVLCCMTLNTAPDRLKMSGSYGYIGILSLASVVLTPMMTSVTAAVGAMKAASGFMLLFVPVFAGIVAASGGISTAASYSAVMLTVCEAVSGFSSFAVAPLVGGYICLGMTAGVSGLDGAPKLAESFKSAINWILGLLMTLFTGFLSLQNVVGRAADNLTLKTTRYFVGSMVPVVGGALSDALMTVTAGIELLRSTAAAWGLLVLCLLFLPTMVSLIVWKIVLKILSAVSKMLSLPEAVGLFEVGAAAISVLIALMLSVSAAFVLSLVILQIGR